VERVLKGGHRVVAFNRTPEKTRDIVAKGAAGAFSLQELADALKAPRVVWVMVPSGDATEKMVEELSRVLSPGDLIVDGGNSRYSDSLRRAEALRVRGFSFVDAGTSGGVWGLQNGYCLMVGGAVRDIERLAPALLRLRGLGAPDGLLESSGHRWFNGD